MVAVASSISDVLASAWEEGCVPHLDGKDAQMPGEADNVALRPNAGTFLAVPRRARI